MAEDPKLQDRLNTFNERRRSGTSGRPSVRLIALTLGLVGAGLAYWLASTALDERQRLETSQVQPFQNDRRAGGRLEFPPDETEERVNEALIAVEDALDLPVPADVTSVPNADVLAEIERLREALAASQTARNAEIQAAVGDLRDAFDAQTSALDAAIEERDRQLAAAERRNTARQASLQSLLDAERAQREALEAEMQNNELIADQRLLDERRRLEAEQQRKEAERRAQDLVTAQVTSPAIVYVTGGMGRSAAATQTNGGPPTATETSLDENETYLRSAARRLEVDEAARMEFPERTLAQGSVIQASLQTAINSDLPGIVVAVVSEPVLAFSGTQTLIPRGSRLFGQYRSDIEVNQKRILILWTRILTPDGTSMTIAAAGGDQLGRSGLAGLVDAKFDERFGGAALITIIGAAPALVAQQSGDEAAGDVFEDVGSDLADATRSVIGDQLSISPTIYVDQGAVVTVLVDRDIVVH